LTDANNLDVDQIALGIQQPWAELILRGVKTVEVRSQPARICGPVYLYASKRFSSLTAATLAMEHHQVFATGLPVGQLVGSVEIVRSRAATSNDAVAACVPAELLVGMQAWELQNPVRFAKPVPVRFLPYGVWFYPFKRRA
jgi:ASCH domain